MLNVLRSVIVPLHSLSSNKVIPIVWKPASILPVVEEETVIRYHLHLVHIWLWNGRPRLPYGRMHHHGIPSLARKRTSPWVKVQAVGMGGLRYNVFAGVQSIMFMANPLNGLTALRTLQSTMPSAGGAFGRKQVVSFPNILGFRSWLLLPKKTPKTRV